MSLGPMELVIILGIALLFFGPSRLPGLGRSLGDAIRGFKRGIDGSEEEIKPVTPVEQIVEPAKAEQKQEEKSKEKVNS